MESRIVLFPEVDGELGLAEPDEACDQWVLSFGDPGSRVQIHADRQFLKRLALLLVGNLEL